MINRNAEASEPAQIGHNLVDIAPAPALGWVVTFDDRVPCRLEVSCRVPVRRVVAAPDMAAGPAQAQMYPRRTGLQAPLAPERARVTSANSCRMSAFRGHQGPPIRAGAALLSVFARNACNAATTCAPSPTAAATRLTEPWRTSPIAKTPGRLVSSGPWRSSPVRIKPLASSAMPEPASQSALGSAPMNR